MAVHVVVFDSGWELANSSYYRVLPHPSAEGDFAMDAAGLWAWPTRARLVLGDVLETAAPFVVALDPASPIGFASFDLDLWSSRVGAFEIFRGAAVICLPGTYSYSDDMCLRLLGEGPFGGSGLKCRGSGRQRQPYRGGS